MSKAELSEYELQRLENIRQNQELLQALNLSGGTLAPAKVVVNRGRAKARGRRSEAKPRARIDKENGSASSADDSDYADSKHGADGAESSDGEFGSTGKRRARRTKQPATRRSKRLRGESIDGEVTAAETQAIETNDFTGVLQTGDERFGSSAAQAVHVTGHYSGWVEPGVMQRLGIQGTAAAAWESEGGGKFSFADPLGTGKKVSKRAAGGQSVAKYVASKLLKKNPNSYFYRHTEPGVEQWTGEWTEEETEMFLRVAKEFGCGDKWGLFSTYIPHRVGYQCSNYYRQYVIPAGWIIDENYRIDGSGSAVYVGSHRRGAR
ncbi:hypothetical protein GGI15_004118 [Coemansia interrupta]|uniref:Myb-like domain-containing protein n=1 Tax=Coemansia interrupta TaxID=1126814 RepID=A0A9W8H5K4_9FUNG|nr:hypothetical protein GGI15_004118 [Coemansia interrupta]